MAPKAMKRRSSVSKGAPPKRLCAKVVDALAKEPWIPHNRDTFLDCVTSSLGVHKDERHEQQQAMVDMIGAGIEERRVALQAAVDEAKIHVDNAPTVKDDREKALGNAKVALAALEQVVEEKKIPLADATTAEADMKKNLQEKIATEKTGEQMLSGLTDTKVKLELMQAAFAVGTEGKISGRSPAVKVPRTFVNIGKELGLEMQMLSALPDILAKEPEKRSEFENFAIENFSKSIAKLAEVYGEDAVKSQETSNAQRAEGVAAAQADLTKASDDKVACNTALAEAKQAVREGKQVAARSQKSVDTYVTDMKVCMDKYDEVKHVLEAFTGGPLAAFDDLKDRVTPEEEPEEPASAEGGNAE